METVLFLEVPSVRVAYQYTIQMAGEVIYHLVRNALVIQGSKYIGVFQWCDRGLCLV